MPSLPDADAPVLTLLSDEGSDQKLSHLFLASCGLRVRLERDFLHRLDNSQNNAVSKAGFGDVVAKCVFLSRVNRTPYQSAANSHAKAEMLLQLKQIGVSDGRVLKDYERSFLFDRQQILPHEENLQDEMFAGTESIGLKTEGDP